MNFKGPFQLTHLMIIWFCDIFPTQCKQQLLGECGGPSPDIYGSSSHVSAPMGPAPAAADWSSIKNNTNTTNNMVRQGFAGKIHCKLVWSVQTRAGDEAGEGTWWLESWPGRKGMRSASKLRVFLKPMWKYYYLPNEQAQFLNKNKNKQTKNLCWRKKAPNSHGLVWVTDPKMRENLQHLELHWCVRFLCILVICASRLRQ